MSDAPVPIPPPPPAAPAAPAVVAAAPLASPVPPASPVPLALPVPLAPQADSDDRLVALWLHGRSRATRRAYAADLAGFRAATATPLRAITVGHVQAYADLLASRAPALTAASRARALSAVKSLLRYAHRLGYLPFDVGAPVTLPPVKTTLAERILAESEVHRLLALEIFPRNHALVRLLYLGGLRISEVCGLRWRDLVARQATASGVPDDGGQVTVFGKGGKTRAVLLPGGLWRELLALRGDAPSDAPVFRSARGGPLDASQVHRIVKAAGRRAGLSPALSAHWLRHAHASHALDRGAPIHLVQATLGHGNVATTGRYLHARPNDSSSRYLAG